MANFEIFSQNVTCFLILFHNLTCFERLVWKCVAVRKRWLKKCTIFTKGISIKICDKARKWQLCCFHSVKWHSEVDSLRANFSKKIDFPQKFSLQNLMHCKFFDSNSHGCWKGWFEILHALENLILNLMSC